MSRWTLILVVALTTACATNCPSGRPCYGRPIEREQVSAIEAGVSTASDVAQRFGEPMDLGIADDGSETWVYRYRSTLHRFEHPEEPCTRLGSLPLVGWLFRGAAYLGLRDCIQSQTEAELRVDFDPRGLVRARELETRERPTRLPPPPPDPEP